MFLETAVRISLWEKRTKVVLNEMYNSNIEHKLKTNAIKFSPLRFHFLQRRVLKTAWGALDKDKRRSLFKRFSIIFLLQIILEGKQLLSQLHCFFVITTDDVLPRSKKIYQLLVRTQSAYLLHFQFCISLKERLSSPVRLTVKLMYNITVSVRTSASLRSFFTILGAVKRGSLFLTGMSSPFCSADLQNKAKGCQTCLHKSNSPIHAIKNR